MKRIIQIILFGVLVVIIGCWWTSSSTQLTQTTFDKKNISINELTRAEHVISFVKKNSSLPNYYITKSEARKAGWEPHKGNLCEVLPGKAIGGDRFTNRERKLPVKKNRIWKEADVNYNCGKRNGDRLVYSNDGLIYLTIDHYQSFEQQ